MGDNTHENGLLKQGQTVAPQPAIADQIEALRSVIDPKALFPLIVRCYFEELITKNAAKNNANEAAAQAIELAKKVFANPPEYHFRDDGSISRILPFTVGNAICCHVETFSTAIDMAKKSHDYSFLHFLIDSVFTNLTSLSHSFRSQTFAIDFEALDAMYKAIESLKDEETGKKLSAAMGTVAQKLASSAKQFTNANEISPICIVLMCPLFMDPSLHDTLVQVIRAVLLLPRHLKIELKNQMLDVPKEIFSDVISIFQQYITVQLFSLGFINENVAYATRVLGILNDVNEMKHKLQKDKVDFQEFYNDAVNNIVNLRQDYMRWMRARRTHRIGTSFEDFCFAAHPFILDPAGKSKLLQYDALNQQQNQINNAMYTTLLGLQRSNLSCFLKVRRDNLIYTALSEIMTKQEDLKKPLRVVFVGEEGVDDGGVRTEFFSLVLKQIFDNEFKLIGTMIGLAIYNGIILDIKLPLVVYKKLLGMEPTFDDLESLDPELHRGLQQLLDFEGDVEDVYCRTFEVESEAFGSISKYELIPNGANIAVTCENRKQYVDLFTQWKLVGSVNSQFEAFAEGFRMVCDGEVLRLFRPEELELMICGTQLLDFNELERFAIYGSGYNKEHPTIRMFWDVVKEFSNEQKQRFLAFVTGSDRVPLKGLGSLGFTIIRNGEDSEQLPTSHVCYAYLLLPEYQSENKLREKLLKAIENSEGFGLK